MLTYLKYLIIKEQFFYSKSSNTKSSIFVYLYIPNLFPFPLYPSLYNYVFSKFPKTLDITILK